MWVGRFKPACPAHRSAQHRIRRASTDQPTTSTQTKDDQAIAEAFAQQAYTAVGNRDRKIMCDPYLLGFEIVDKNEDNNRLVGVFAFRISGEIFMVPVFYLNGQIKGQDLIYRKSVNRFYPNTEKWVGYFVGKGDDATGRPVDRRSNRDARIHLGIDRMSRMPGYKSAAEIPIDIQAEWKQACAHSGFKPEQFLFADFLVDHGLQKAASNLAEKLPWFADAIVLGGLLDKPLTKRASAPSPGTLEFHVDPPAGATADQVSAHYTRGYTLVDKRAAESLAAAIDSSPVSRTWSSVRKTGINYVAGRDGSKVKVLWAPTSASVSPHTSVTNSRHRENYQEYRLVLLEGPDIICPLLA